MARSFARARPWMAVTQKQTQTQARPNGSKEGAFLWNRTQLRQEGMAGHARRLIAIGRFRRKQQGGGRTGCKPPIQDIAMSYSTEHCKTLLTRSWTKTDPSSQSLLPP